MFFYIKKRFASQIVAPLFSYLDDMRTLLLLLLRMGRSIILMDGHLIIRWWLGVILVVIVVMLVMMVDGHGHDGRIEDRDWHGCACGENVESAWVFLLPPLSWVGGVIVVVVIGREGE